jgi:hypothetical protein
MTTGIKCDECNRFIATEVLEGQEPELYVQINFMEGYGCYLPLTVAFR